MDRAGIIKEKVLMSDVLRQYGFPDKKRMPCPLHGGKDENFVVKEREWRCYSRCGRGDVISFVQLLFGLSFPDALRKIDADFGLGLYGVKDYKNYRKAYYETKWKQAVRNRQKAEREKDEVEYWKIFDEWKRLDDNKRKYAPKTPDEEWHPLFVEALQKLAHQEYLLEIAEERRARERDRGKDNANASERNDAK